MDAVPFLTDLPILEIGITVWVLSVIVGIVLGVSRRIIVFRDYADLGVVGFTWFSGLASAFLYNAHQNALNDGAEGFGIFLYTALAIFCFLGVVIVIRSIAENGFLKGMIAVLTKMSLGFMLVLALYDLISPQGKTSSERLEKQVGALIILAILAPLVRALVYNKKGTQVEVMEPVIEQGPSSH